MSLFKKKKKHLQVEWLPGINFYIASRLSRIRGHDIMKKMYSILSNELISGHGFHTFVSNY